jgi:hypothetical protein
MPKDDSLNQLLTESLEHLEKAMMEGLMLSRSSDVEYKIGTLGRSIGLVREFQSDIFERRPDLKPEVKIDIDPGLSEEQSEICSMLSNDQLEMIDKALLSNVSSHFSKVAKVIALTMTNELSELELPDIFYSQRIQKLVKLGTLDYQGNLNAMRFSEIKLQE